MKSFRLLAPAILVAGCLAPLPARADTPPFSIQTNPAVGADGAASRFKPLRTGNEAITDQVCKLEIWTEPAGHGATWIGGADTTCAREESVTLPGGRYRVKLGVGWKSGGTSRYGTVEIPYEVRLALPPFKIAVTPPLTSVEGTAVKIKPVVTQPAALSQQVCKLEVWPEASGHGSPVAIWAGTPDPGCAREETVSLAAGRYVIRLGAGWQPAGGGPSRFTTIESPYDVTAGDRIQMTQCTFSTAQPMAGRPLSVSWEVRNISAYPTGNVRVAVLVDQQDVSGPVFLATLAPGATVSRTVTFTPRSAGTFRSQCVVDPENRLHEPSDGFKNNAMNGEIHVARAEILRPVIQLGKLHMSPIYWKQEYTICNVDLDAFYRNELSGCPRPCTGGYDGTPSRDFTPSSFSADGSGIVPRCPAGLTSSAALNPGTAEGARNQYEDRTYTLTVTAAKDGQSAGVSVPIRVPQNCGMLSIPICVPMEGKGR